MNWTDLLIAVTLVEQSIWACMHDEEREREIFGACLYKDDSFVICKYFPRNDIIFFIQLSICVQQSSYDVMNRTSSKPRSQHTTARSPSITSTKEPRPQETMSSWLERQSSNHHVQLAATAILSGAVVAGAIFGTQAIRRKEAVEELKASIPELSDDHKADLVRRRKKSQIADSG